MSEVIENNSIQGPEEALSPALNFQNLKQIGLDTIIQTGSDAWTDYNAHDPGMTILEMLIYSLTDLAYRTDFPITDILAQQQLSTEQLSETQFYTARKILSTNPVTLNDLRKLLIDQQGVGNAWVLFNNDPLNTVGGVVDILIDPFPEPKDALDQEAIVDNVRNAYLAHRNLGQDIGNIGLRTVLPILFNLELIISPNAIAEEVLAQVLLTLDNYLSSTVTFLSLPEMMTLCNNDVNQVFSGPELLHGFLPDEALLPMK